MAPEQDTSTTELLKLLIASEIKNVRDAIEALYARSDERDRLYTERDAAQKAAVAAALMAQKEQTAAAFLSSEKAIVKAEEAQKAYNVAHNDLAHKMDDQAKMTMPRSETEARFHALAEKLDEVKTSVTGVTAAATGGKTVKDDGRANIGMLVGLVGAVLAVVAFFLRKG